MMNAQPGRRWPRLAPASLLLAMAPAVAQFFPPPLPVNIKQQPLPARVAAGHGTEFSVLAIPDKNVVITRYDWMLDGRIVQTGTKPVWAIPAAQLSQAGQVSVNVVTSAGTVTSQAARLDVIGSGWVQVGGRPVSTQAAAQAPAVEVCGDISVAWVQTASGPGQVQAHRFDGTGWRRMGAASVHARAGSDGAEPWLQCSDMPGHEGPLLVFSEAAASGRTIELRRFDGRNWLPLTSPPATAGAEARKPILRVVSGLGFWPPMTQIATKTAVAWLESGRPKVYQWLGQSWAGGFAPGQDQDQLALAVDTFLRKPATAPYPALLAGTVRGSFGALNNRWRPDVGSNVFGSWSSVGHSLAVPTPAGIPVRMLGLAASEDASAPRATVVWAEINGSAYTLKSASLGGIDYELSMLDLNAQAAWQGYASARGGTGLAATAFDAQAHEGPCFPTLGTVKSFTLALTDALGTDVWRTDCSNGLPAWRTLGNRLPVRSAALGLRMLDWRTPLVASVEPRPGGGHQFSVWRYHH